ncbi:MAG: sugar transferase [Thermonemataceae bacterium]
MIYQKIIKPTADRVVAIILLLVCSPILIILIMIQALAYRGNIFYRQARVGYHQQPFLIFKFTTMRPAHPQSGVRLTDKARITKLGEVLRKTHLDELPQLYNILRGEMSFVGPRPLLPAYLAHYTFTEQQRHDVTAGLTGLAQINGGQSLAWSKKMAWDVWYVRHQSFRLDMYILWKTAQKLLRPDPQEVFHHETNYTFKSKQLK